MDLKIRNEISRTNSFTFSNISSLNGSHGPVDQQVSKLVKFVQCQKNALVKKELETLLPPLVCHLFIEMLKGKDWRPAHEFLRKYSTLTGVVQEIPAQKINGSDPNAIMPHQIHFLQLNNFHQQPFQRLPSTSRHQPPLLTQLNIDESKLCLFRELITNLSCVRRLEDVKDNKLVISFRSCKYKAQLSKKSLTILNKFLAKHGHVLIIQILHVWFSMNLYELTDDSNDDSSSSSSDCTILNHFEYSDGARHNNNRYTDPSHCDNPKDIKLSKFQRRLDGESDADTKLKRLRDCLHRIDNKYHKPIRIFNINYTENR